MILTARPIDAATALARGLVSAVVEPERDRARRGGKGELLLNPLNANMRAS